MDSELTNPMEESYGVSPGESIIIPIDFTNSGNGEKNMTLSLMIQNYQMVVS